MSAQLTLHGVEELREALRNLPAELAGEAGHLVLGAANGAAVDVRANYGRHRRTGDLQDKVTVAPLATGALTAGAKVTSGSRLATIFEYGTQARHYVTVAGHTHRTGRMPPFHAFVPPVVRARRRMQQDLIDLLTRHGLQVTGDGGT